VLHYETLAIWQIDPDGAGRAGGVRAAPDFCPDKRGAEAGQGQWGAVRATAQADAAPGGEALKRVTAGEPLREIALSFNVDHSTISRLKARHAAETI